MNYNPFCLCGVCVGDGIESFPHEEPKQPVWVRPFPEHQDATSEECDS